MAYDYNKKYPKQARAKWLVQVHVRRGKMLKPDYCQMCGKAFPVEKLQAHHHSYAKPLEVSWYCNVCHKEVHKRLGKAWKDTIKV